MVFTKVDRYYKYESLGNVSSYLDKSSCRAAQKVKDENTIRKTKMSYKKISWLAVAVKLEIAVCSSTVDILHLQDEQQEDASSSIEKRSLKSGVSLRVVITTTCNVENAFNKILFYFSGI